MRSYSKYKARRIIVNGITFASRAEANRYQDLHLLEVVGVISELEPQSEFIILEQSRDNFTRKKIPTRESTS